ncbi:MAG: MerC domain-containing protein [Pseudomonadota bacterium]
MDNHRYRSLADWLGIAASSACAIHCLIVPIILVLGTAAPTSIFLGEGFHRALLWIILPAALFAFGIGCRQHKDVWVLVLGLLGLTGIILSATVVNGWVGEDGERATTLLSAGLLVYAHYRNYRLCRSAQCADDKEKIYDASVGQQ